MKWLDYVVGNNSIVILTLDDCISRDPQCQGVEFPTESYEGFSLKPSEIATMAYLCLGVNARKKPLEKTESNLGLLVEGKIKPMDNVGNLLRTLSGKKLITFFNDKNKEVEVTRRGTFVKVLENIITDFEILKERFEKGDDDTVTKILGINRGRFLRDSQLEEVGNWGEFKKQKQEEIDVIHLDTQLRVVKKSLVASDYTSTSTKKF